MENEYQEFGKMRTQENKRTPEQEVTYYQERENWIQKSQRRWIQSDIQYSQELVDMIMGLLQTIKEKNYPIPRFLFLYEQSLLFISPVSVKLRKNIDTNRIETLGVSKQIEFEFWQQYSKEHGQRAYIRSIYVSWRDINSIQRELQHFVEQLESQEITYETRIFKDKTGKLSEADREWRMNYYTRVFYDVIPRRPGDDDANPNITRWKLWKSAQSPTKEQALELKTLLESNQIYPTQSLTRMVDGKYYTLHFDQACGLYTFVETDHLAVIPEEDEDSVAKAVFLTPLPYPPSVRALPSAKKMNEKTGQMWLNRCPRYMQSWKTLLIKSDVDMQSW